MITTDILIIGAGPTGLFTVFEAGLLKLKCHLIDALPQPGGQCSEIYPKKPIYDIPGFPEILAGDLTKNLLEQSKQFEPGFTLGERAETIEKQEDGSFIVTTNKGTKHQAPIVAIAGWAYASHAEAALSDAKKTRHEVSDAISKMEKAKSQLIRTREYVDYLYTETNRIHLDFSGYFDELKRVHQFVKNGEDVATLKDEIMLVVTNGYKVAAILTDIITTPLFKPKLDEEGNVVISDSDTVEIETDADGMQVINYDALNEALGKA